LYAEGAGASPLKAMVNMKRSLLDAEGFSA